MAKTSKKKITSILDLQLNDYIEKSGSMVSLNELCNEFNEKVTPIHYNDFQSIIGRDFGKAYQVDGEGFPMMSLKMKTDFLEVYYDTDNL